jgi:hypothetical protein
MCALSAERMAGRISIALRNSLLLLLLLLSGLSYGQVDGGTSGPQFMLTEEIGLPLNKAQLAAAVMVAWDHSFGREPGARIARVDAEDGVLEGQARLNFRSAMLAYREESMGVVTYIVSIHIRNGQCTVHLHDVKHTGNRGALGGGLDLGLLREGEAPLEHYPGLGLKFSRRLHAEVLAVAESRMREMIRLFAARLRQQAAP